MTVENIPRSRIFLKDIPAICRPPAQTLDIYMTLTRLQLLFMDLMQDQTLDICHTPVRLQTSSTESEGEPCSSCYLRIRQLLLATLGAIFRTPVSHSSCYLRMPCRTLVVLAAIYGWLVQDQTLAIFAILLLDSSHIYMPCRTRLQLLFTCHAFPLDSRYSHTLARLQT